MPTGKKLNVLGRRQKRAAEFQLFVQATGRRKQRAGLDPNDRFVDRGTTEEVRRMKPEEFDRFLRNGEDC